MALESEIGSGFVDHIAKKGGHKVAADMRVKKVSAFEKLKRSMADGTGNDSLQGKARNSSAHRVSARLIRFNATVDQTPARDLRRQKLTSALRATDYQTTHRDELVKKGGAESTRSDWARRQIFNTARFSHMLGDLCNGITSAMKEVVNNAVNPNNRKKSADGKAKMAIGSGLASILIGMNSKLLRTFGDMIRPHRNLTVENLQQRAGLTEQQAQAVINDVSALNGNELRQLDADQLGQTTDLSALSAEQQESLLSTLTTLNSTQMLTSFYGWYWQGCTHYAMSAIVRGIGRLALSGSVSATDGFIQDHLQGEKDATLRKIFMLKEAVKGCETDQYLVRKALSSKFQGLQLLGRTFTSKDLAKSTFDNLWARMAPTNNVQELEQVFSDYMNEDGLTVRQQNEREEQFIGIANLVEHFKISGNKVEDDTTGRLRVQDATLNGLPFLNGNRTEYKGVLLVDRLKARAKSGGGKFLSLLGMTDRGNKMITNARRELVKAMGNEKALKQRISNRSRDNYGPGNFYSTRSDCQVILKEKDRHNFLTVGLARVSETLRFIGHHGIVSSDTNLGRVCGKAFELAAKRIMGTRGSILTTRALGMVLGVGAVGVGLSFMSMGFSALGVIGGIPLGSSGISMSFASLAFGCMVFVAASVAFDLAAKASIKLFGSKPYEVIKVDTTLRRLGPASPRQFV